MALVRSVSRNVIDLETHGGQNVHTARLATFSKQNAIEARESNLKSRVSALRYFRFSELSSVNRNNEKDGPSDDQDPGCTIKHSPGWAPVNCSCGRALLLGDAGNSADEDTAVGTGLSSQA